MTPAEFANQWVGVPFRWDGRDLTGVDCYGLIIAWARDVLNKDIPDWRPSTHDRCSVARALEAHGMDAIESTDFADANVAIAYGNKVALHTGIVVSGKVLHTSELRGVVCERRSEFESMWKRVDYGLLVL